MENDLIPWATAHYKVFASGRILQQEYANRYFSFSQYLIDPLRPVVLYFRCPRPMMVLQFTFGGTADCIQEGGTPILLEGGKAGLLYFTGDIQIRISSGKFKMLLIQFKNNMAAVLADYVPEFRGITQKIQQRPAKGLYAFPVQTSFLMAATLERMSSLALTGRMLELELLIRTLELVRLYNQAILEMQEIPDPPGLPHKDKMIGIYNEIMHRPNIQDCKLETLSRKYFLNKTSISRCFYQLFNMHLADFVLNKVMEKAIYLLTNTDKPVADIAEELGYSTSSNFSRSFMMTYGESPSETRKNREQHKTKYHESCRHCA
jgi:AraC-like DNA-binding protein